MTEIDLTAVSARDAGRLYAVARALAAALTADDVAAAVFEHALADLGARTAGFWLLEDDTIHFAGGAGHEDDTPERVGPIPIDSDMPAAVCVRSGEVVFFGSIGERDERWPALAGVNSISTAVVVLPLVARETPLGCLHIGYPATTARADIDLAILLRVAELAAAALDRARLFDSEREHRQQLQFLSDATSVLMRSLEPLDVLQALVDIAVPRLADWCSVLILDDEVL